MSKHPTKFERDLCTAAARPFSGVKLIVESLVSICHPRAGSAFPCLPISDLEQVLLPSPLSAKFHHHLGEVHLIVASGVVYKFSINFFRPLFQVLVDCGVPSGSLAPGQRIILFSKFGVLLEAWCGGHFYYFLRFSFGAPSSSSPCYFQDPLTLSLVLLVQVPAGCILLIVASHPCPAHPLICFNQVPALEFWQSSALVRFESFLLSKLDSSAFFLVKSSSHCRIGHLQLCFWS